MDSMSYVALFTVAPLSGRTRTRRSCATSDRTATASGHEAHWARAAVTAAARVSTAANVVAACLSAAG